MSSSLISADPLGSAKTLFKESYHQLMKVALKDGGACPLPGRVAVSGWPPDLRFPCGDFRLLHRSHLPSGPMGSVLCSKYLSTDFRKLTQPLTQKQAEPMLRKYYNSHVPQKSPSCPSVPPPP